MKYLVDTNVMFRLVHPNDPLHETVNNCASKLTSQGEELFITAQSLVEYWALATRPLSANGLQQSAARTKLDIEEIKVSFSFLAETAAIYPIWERLAESYEVIGRQVYDTRLVAVMMANEMTHLLTFDTQHFKRFSGITPVDPRAILED